MSEVPIIPIPIGGIGGRIISILKDFIDRFINFFRFIGKTIDRLIQRVTSNRLWRIMARFIKLLTNPKLSIPLLAGLSLMFTMLVHVAEEHEDTVKLLKQNVDKWINNVYKTIRNVADYLWHEAQTFTVNININVWVIGGAISTLLSTILTWTVRIFFYTAAIVVRCIAETVRYILMFITQVIVWGVEMFIYMARIVAYFGKILIQDVLMPIATGIAVTRMFLESLYTLPTSIEQPVDIIDRGIGFLTFTLLYPLALHHVGITVPVSKIGTIPRPTPPPPPSPAVPTVIYARIVTEEELSQSKISPMIRTMTLTLPVTVSEHVGIGKPKHVTTMLRPAVTQSVTVSKAVHRIVTVLRPSVTDMVLVACRLRPIVTVIKPTVTDRVNIVTRTRTVTVSITPIVVQSVTVGRPGLRTVTVSIEPTINVTCTVASTVPLVKEHDTVTVNITLIKPGQVTVSIEPTVTLTATVSRYMYTVSTTVTGGSKTTIVLYYTGTVATLLSPTIADKVNIVRVTRHVPTTVTDRVNMMIKIGRVVTRVGAIIKPSIEQTVKISKIMRRNVTVLMLSHVADSVEIRVNRIVIQLVTNVSQSVNIVKTFTGHLVTPLKSSVTDSVNISKT